MRKLIISALMLAASLACWAQSYDPRVAYTTFSAGKPAIVLANQDGSKAVAIYGSKTALSGVDFAPGGGRIAFNEFSTLKMLTYKASNSGIAVTGVTTLTDMPSAGSPDFSPDGKMILYIGDASLTTTREVREIPANGSSKPKVLMSDMSGLTEVAWLGSTRQFVYLRQYGQYAWDQRAEVHLVTLDDNHNPTSDDMLLTTLGSSFLGISSLDVSRTRNSILVTLHYPTTMRIEEYDLSARRLIPYVTGYAGHFSSDDSKIVYLDTSGNYLNSFDVMSGTTTRLTKRGNFSVSIDARP